MSLFRAKIFLSPDIEILLIRNVFQGRSVFRQTIARSRDSASCWTLHTPNSMTRASTMLPMTVMKSNVFQGSLKKFCLVAEKEGISQGRTLNDNVRGIGAEKAIAREFYRCISRAFQYLSPQLAISKRSTHYRDVIGFLETHPAFC